VWDQVEQMRTHKDMAQREKEDMLTQKLGRQVASPREFFFFFFLLPSLNVF